MKADTPISSFIPDPACPGLARASFILDLADGTRLALCAGDKTAAPVVAFLARAARLTLAPDPLPPGALRLHVVTASGGQADSLPSGARTVSEKQGCGRVASAAGPDARRSELGNVLPSAWSGNGADRHAPPPPTWFLRHAPGSDAAVVYALEPTDTLQPWRRRRNPTTMPQPLTAEQWLCQQLVRLSACIAQQTQHQGGVLLHSGLALAFTSLHPPAPLPSSLPPGWGEPGAGGDVAKGGLGRWGEGGILLAGRSGVGKSTAGRRLPRPWRALADDATLVVRDEGGTYWAHPWPTWSRFFGEERGDGRDSWDVQRAAPLRAIFVLEQGEEDRVDPLGPGHAVALLAELARQTSTHFLRGWPVDEIAAFNHQRFENLCALVRAVPAFTLYVSRRGAFWDEIARALQ